MRRNKSRAKATQVRITTRSKVSVRVRDRNAMAVVRPPFWVNPCGLSSNGLPEDDQEEIPMEELVPSLIEVTSNAQTKLDDIKTRYFRAIFDKEPYDETKFDEIKFQWLPDLPKTLGADVPQERLRDVDFKTALQLSYTNLQTVAAAMECVLKNPKFRRLKADIIGHIQLVLCELHEKMIYSKVNPPPDVDRAAIPEDFQEVDQTTGTVRDWVVFRELRNNIEYILQLFSYIQNN